MIFTKSQVVSEYICRRLYRYFVYYDIDATIVFNTPNYKVWVGNFKTRIEAERYLIEIKKKYKNVLLIKPSK